MSELDSEGCRYGGAICVILPAAVAAVPEGLTIAAVGPQEVSNTAAGYWQGHTAAAERATTEPAHARFTGAHCTKHNMACRDSNSD
jgi:hypothetical protein